MKASSLPPAALPARYRRLELGVRAAYHAADAAPIDPQRRCAAGHAAGTRLTLAPASADPFGAPVATIWLAHRPGGPALPGADAAAEDALVTRPGFDPSSPPCRPAAAPLSPR
ncbi:MAG: hypothetical protein JKP98_06830 [Rhodobacteraceae bacterium]|nr:hypothetical protein [Paracoccaceae bacterium]